jgi:competence protein ComEC
MNRNWILGVVAITFLLLSLLKLEELKQFQPYFKAQPTYKLKRFEEAKKVASPKDLELLELWESMLTGRSAPVSKWIKDQYKTLGLNHLFTPSGFHLSAVMMPFMKLIKLKSIQFWILFLVGVGIFSLAGQGALKRMVLIKLNQHWLGQKTGFVLALCLDVLWGSFTDSPLSFCYSFLFLGIIYSGRSFIVLWFFFAQSLIAYFSGDNISPMIIFLSPLLNLAFGLSMPLLLILAFPLCGWQVQLGLKILYGLQKLVEISASVTQLVPTLEINLMVLVCFGLLFFRKRKVLALAMLVLPFGLTMDKNKAPGFSRYDFVPQGQVVKIIYHERGETVYFNDGKCKRDLLRGVWWERCSPLRGSKKNKIKKLSSLS